MENENPNMPQADPASPSQGGGMKEKCAKTKPLWCVAIMAVLIIVLTWWWIPSWANIAITVLAGLMIIRAFCPKNFK